jgi:hypothetical protein
MGSIPLPGSQNVFTISNGPVGRGAVSVFAVVPGFSERGKFLQGSLKTPAAP